MNDPGPGSPLPDRPWQLLRARLPRRFPVGAAGAFDFARGVADGESARLGRVLAGWWDLARRIESTSDRSLVARVRRLTKAAEAQPPYSGPESLGAIPLAAALRGELLWTAGLTLKELPPAAEWIDRGRGWLAAVLGAMDRDGWPADPDPPALDALVGSLTRSLALGRTARHPPWPPPLQARYAALVRIAVHLTRPDGSAILGGFGRGAERCRALARAACLCGDRAARLVLGWLEPQPAGTAPTAGQAPRRRVGKPPEPQLSRADGTVALLRSDWSRWGDALAVLGRGGRIHLELICRGRPIVSGIDEVGLRGDGQPLPLDQPGRRVGWQANAAGMFLRWRSATPGGLRLDRDLWLARTEALCVMADRLWLDRPAEIDLIHSLPLAPGVRARSAGAAGAAWLVPSRTAGTKGSVAVQVLALGGPGSRTVAFPGRLRSEHHRRGRCLDGVTVFSWAEPRRRQRLAWRPLTVTEDGEIVGPDRAVAYLIRWGDSRLVIYRGIHGHAALRAFLGHQTRHATVIGWFTATGRLQILLQVET